MVFILEAPQKHLFKALGRLKRAINMLKFRALNPLRLLACFFVFLGGYCFLSSYPLWTLDFSQQLSQKHLFGAHGDLNRSQNRLKNYQSRCRGFKALNLSRFCISILRPPEALNMGVFGMKTIVSWHREQSFTSDMLEQRYTLIDTYWEAHGIPSLHLLWTYDSSPVQKHP